MALRSLLAALCLTLLAAPAANCGEQNWAHGGALFGKLKYGPDFKQYDYVNADAPTGGTLNQAAFGGFDSFNPFVVRGRPAAGLTYTGGLLYDTLFEQAADQPSAAYGLVADAYRHADDYSWAVYRIDQRARWHDGVPITPEDVIWSLEVLREYQPLYTQYYRNVVDAKKTGEHEVTFTFNVKGNRELPQIIGDLPVLPKHWWEANGPDGKKRNIAEPTVEPPLGSGPYRIGNFDLGKSITWERVDDYWAKDIPVRRGRYNFDRIRYTYFLDENAIWEAFKKGGLADTRTENVSRRWATEYDFPAITRGNVKRGEFATEGSLPYQAYFFNLRKSKFKDERVREALTLLFDFESMNKTLFFGLYNRTKSYFEGGELAADTAPPQGREREILEGYRGRIPDALFDQAIELPVYNQPGERKHLAAALKLFEAAGLKFAGGKLIGADGKPFTIEILGDSPTDQRVGIPTQQYFAKLGIDVSLRIVDDAQYKSRLDNFDFEMTMQSTIQSLSPGNEQREFWGAKAAAAPGSRNYSGISDPVIDELVERIIQAKDREEQVALTHALDRILRWGHYSIPMWNKAEVWYAWWRKLQFPPSQPKELGIDLYSLWIDTAVEKELEATR